MIAFSPNTLGKGVCTGTPQNLQGDWRTCGELMAICFGCIETRSFPPTAGSWEADPQTQLSQERILRRLLTSATLPLSSVQMWEVSASSPVVRTHWRTKRSSPLLPVQPWKAATAEGSGPHNILTPCGHPETRLKLSNNESLNDQLRDMGS